MRMAAVGDGERGMAIRDCQACLGAKVLTADQFQLLGRRSALASVSFETENENDEEGRGTATQNDRLHTRSLDGRTDGRTAAALPSAPAPSPLSE